MKRIFNVSRGVNGLRSRAGFTLIELLVVIAIIAMAASIIFIRLQGVRTRVRDAEREQEIKSLQNALTLYVTNKRAFPIYAGPLTGTDALSAELLAAGAIQAIPKDPLNTGNYTYSYASLSGQTYALTYTLETDSIPGKARGAQSVGP